MDSVSTAKTISGNVTVLDSSVGRYHQLRYAADLVASYVKRGVLIDIGCGDGLLAGVLPNLRVVGVDKAYGALRSAVRQTTGAKFVIGDLKQVPVKDEVADGVALIAVLGAVEEGGEKVALAEAWRVLKKGGHAIVLVSRRSVYSTIASERVVTRWRWRHFQVKGLLRVAEEAGLECVFVSYRAGPLSVLSDLTYRLLASLIRKAGAERFCNTLSARLVRLYNFVEGLEFRSMPRWLARYAYLVLRKPVSGRRRNLESHAAT